MQRAPFIWNEIEHWVGGDLMDTIQLLTTDAEAADFMEAYTEACGGDEDYAITNVRYMLDIIAHDSDNAKAEEQAQELAELFMVELPSASEVISPQNWWKDSSYGVKVAA